MAKPLSDFDIKLLQYIAREIGIDRHTGFRVPENYLLSIGRLALREIRRIDAEIPDFEYVGGQHLFVYGDGKDYLRQRAQKRADWYVRRYGHQLRHIVDWLTIAGIENHAWLHNLDNLGRPKKLMKCGTIAALWDEADRQLDRHRQSTGAITRPLTQLDLRWECDLGFGLRLIRLMTPAALDDESARMNHCLGFGSYDRNLRDPRFAYYSVRDADEVALATIEVEGSIVRQFVGPGNMRPREDVAITVGTLMCNVGWLHWMEVYAVDVEKYGEFHKLRRLLAMPYHVGVMEWYKALSDQHKMEEIARLREAAGLGPQDQVPEPPPPQFVATDWQEDAQDFEIVFDQSREPVGLDDHSY
jgi:glycosyltransferase involved in cell wall biosynthesis